MFNHNDAASLREMMADVRRLIQYVPMTKGFNTADAVWPTDISLVEGDVSHWSSDGCLTIAKSSLKDPRIYTFAFGHELCHAQQRFLGEGYTHFTGWERMYHYARCPREYQANVVGLSCMMLWDARAEGHVIDHNDPKLERLAKKMIEHQNNLLRAAQQELELVKGASDDILHAVARRHNLSWRPTGGS